MKDKIRKYVQKEDRENEKEKKDVDNMEKIVERYIDKKKTLLFRKERSNKKEKVDTWLKRHAGEVEYK